MSKSNQEALAIVQSYIVEAEDELARRVRRLKDGVADESGDCASSGRMPSPFLNDALTSHLGMLVARAQVDALRTVEIHLIRLAEKTAGGSVSIPLDEQVAYWRARCPVEEEDIEQAGVTWNHIEAWIIAQPDGGGVMCTDGRPFESWRLKNGTWIWACGPRVHSGRAILVAVRTVAMSTKLSAREVLDQIARSL